MASKWLTPAEQDAWRSFITALPDLMSAFENDLAPHGLTMGDYEVLVFLSEAEDNRMRMCDLASSLRLSPSGLTRRLDGMVKLGWVSRASCDNDRRVMYAHLTPAGRAKMEAAAPDHVASVRRHFIAPLGLDGVDQVGELFRRIRNHLLQPA
ncbi:MAG TPA: MarR family transcriptional regulator [Ilumatobacteraceae bacterium]|nr:MarR family transcriptional regulator [Ilumatobacteraceae bacterium]